MMALIRHRAVRLASRPHGACLATLLGGLVACAMAAGPSTGADSDSLAGASLSVATNAPGTYDCSGYQRLLNEYLVVTSSPGQPLETRFNYNALEARKDRGVRFALIRQQLLDVDPSRMKDKERLTWAINAYNFLVIQTVTDNMFEPFQIGQKGERRFFYRNRHSTVQTISVGGEKFFEAIVVEIEGRPYSLNTFERHFVFGDYDSTTRKPPPARLDPRAHFALVCAAKGCPPLRTRCYRADSLDQQLEAATREALESPAHLRWDKATGKLEVSAIFDWYRGDFGGMDGAFAFIKKYAPPTVRAEVEAAKKRWWSWAVRWDWSLNHTEVSTEETPEFPK